MLLDFLVRIVFCSYYYDVLVLKIDNIEIFKFNYS